MPPYAPVFSLTDFDNPDGVAVLRRCQRRIAELEAQVEKEKAAKKTPGVSEKTFTNLGHCIQKVVSMFGSIESLIAENDRRQDLALERSEGDEVHDEEEEYTEDQIRAFNGYKEPIRFVPAIRKPLMESEHEELVAIFKALTHGARNARSDDTKNLKAAIVPWLQRLFINMPALDVESREDRGIYNDFVGALLCPTEYNWDDLQVRTMIREGDADHLVTAGSWFKGLYPHDKFDPENPDIGLFRNALLMNVWQYIFTSPISVKAKKGPAQTPKRSVATLIGLKRVTGRSIAYAAVQYRVALSDSRQWDQYNGSFDYNEFYNKVVDYFESPPGPVAKLEVDRLLDFWNTYEHIQTPAHLVPLRKRFRGRLFCEALARYTGCTQGGVDYCSHWTVVVAHLELLVPA
ncbi:hypothetical protein DFH07DRAFT_948173 [Mycena maculata]|uniref:Uncharacterized protein n=1 Tax=Mycena maculata TaxID=230809 RepID=A0AAD7KGG3_9AGAR|nr:hypothetical protein DFH07DRAFT_948173 [Mycena maculata]